MGHKAFAQLLLAIAAAILLFNLVQVLLVIFTLGVTIYTLYLARKDENGS